MTSRILIVGAADGRPIAEAGHWLVSCDVDANGGRGDVRVSNARTAAKPFADFGDAMDYWRRVSLVRPRRPDGKPNRPLTAYTVEVVKDGVEPLL